METTRQLSFGGKTPSDFKNKIGVYSITVKHDVSQHEMKFIGSSTNLSVEFEKFRNELLEDKYEIIGLQHLYNIGTLLVVELIEECKKEKLQELTEFYINKYNTTHPFLGWNKETDNCKSQDIVRDTDTDDEESDKADIIETTFTLKELKQIYDTKRCGIKIRLYSPSKRRTEELEYDEWLYEYNITHEQLYLISQNQIKQMNGWYNADLFQH